MKTRAQAFKDKLEHGQEYHHWIAGVVWSLTYHPEERSKYHVQQGAELPHHFKDIEEAVYFLLEEIGEWDWE